ncbi:MAG: tripartite tricarboxylate transporter substrate binding protein [Pseudolabrys sp.]|nr:tripartite tricarboxylate transporter substrate binding protein [Pseudolabrys sp.]
MDQLRIALLGLTLVSTGLAPASAQNGEYPNRPVQLVVPFSPGASTDLVARFLAPYLTEELGKPVVVENRAGAGGLIGASVVAKSPADGHVLLVASSTVLQSPLLQKSPAFSATKDFAPVGAVFQHPFAVISSGKLIAKTLPEFIAYAKANPGQVNTGSLGGFSDVISAMFIRAAGIDAHIIPYRGASEAMVGVIRGDAHLMFTVYGAAQSQIATGEVRLLGVTSLKRSPPLPNVPTLVEGGLKDFEILNVVGVLAPAGTPAATIARLNNAVAKAMKSQAARDFVAGLGNEEIEDFSPGKYGALIAAADQKYRHVIEELGIPKQ